MESKFKNAMFECMAELVATLTDGKKAELDKFTEQDTEVTAEIKFRNNFDTLSNRIKGFRILLGREVQYVQQLIPNSTYVVKVKEVKDQQMLEYLTAIAENLRVNFVLFDDRMEVTSCPPGYRIVAEQRGPKIIGA